MSLPSLTIEALLVEVLAGIRLSHPRPAPSHTPPMTRAVGTTPLPAGTPVSDAPALTEKAAFVVSEKSDRFTHGGARNGAGRPSTPIDLKRVKALRAQKFSTREIAERFGVPHHVVKYALLKEKSHAQQQ